MSISTIAIAGYGIEGRASLEYFLNKYPEADFTVFDEADKCDVALLDVKKVLGKNAFDKIHGFDLVVRSPGLSPYRFPKDNKKIWSATNEFFAECTADIIGVTGSKGKGTTASLIASILREKGNRNIHLLGNIGVPALSQLQDIRQEDVVVFELSSFQLWDLEMSPHVAVITMIEPDHLDVHKGFSDYIKAKGNIARHQSVHDRVVYNADDKEARKIADSSVSEHKIDFPNKKFVHIEQDCFFYGSKRICETSLLKLPGEHNKKNAMAAIAATWDYVDGDIEAITKGLTNFEGLPHRLKFVREVKGVKFYDDSIATTPGSAIAAIRSFVEPKVLILGGYDKGADYTELGQEIAINNVRKVFVIGQNKAKIADHLKKADLEVDVQELYAENMTEIVKEIFSQTLRGDVVILSPAAASFGLFASYVDRGEKYVAAVEKLII